MPRKPSPTGHVYLHGRTWRVTFYLDGCRYQRSVCPSDGVEREAAIAQAAKIVSTVRAELDRAKNNRASQNPFVLYQRRLDHRSLSHQANCARYHKRLLKFFGRSRDLRSITRPDVEAWRDWLLEQPLDDKSKVRNLSEKSVKEHLNWLSAIYKCAGLPSPVAGIERPRRSHAEDVEAIKYFTPDELAKMFDVCAQRQPHFYNGFVFLAYTGCRVGEVQGIRPEDINKDQQVVKVTGKGSKVRSLRLTGPMQTAWDALVDELENSPKDHGYVFPQSKNWAMRGLHRLCKSTFGISNPDAPWQRRNPVKHGHPHMLRHTFASLALLHWKPAWDLALLSKWLGHSDISITFKIYAHWIAPEAPSGFVGESFVYKTSTKEKCQPLMTGTYEVRWRGGRGSNN